MKRNSQRKDASLFFLKKYGILIGFEDESYISYKKRISLRDNSTFKDWKEKTFGRSSAEIIIYGGYNPANNTRFDNIIKNNKAKDIFGIIEFYRDEINNKAKTIIAEEKRKICKFPKEILEDCIEEQKADGGLEPSVGEFFKNWLNDNKDEVDTSEILYRLIKAYNSSVKSLRTK